MAWLQLLYKQLVLQPLFPPTCGGQVPESTASSIQPASPTVSSTSEVVIIKPDQQANPTLCSPCQEVVTTMDPKVVQHEGDQEVPRERGIKRKMPEKSDTTLAHKFKAPKFRCRKRHPASWIVWRVHQGLTRSDQVATKRPKGSGQVFPFFRRILPSAWQAAVSLFTYIYTWYFFISYNINI